MGMTVGRPSEVEIDRMEELVDELFVGDQYAIKANFWDDGDVHMTAFSTIGTNIDEGYPMDALEHRQTIRYHRDDDVCIYQNVVRHEFPSPNQVLERREVDFL